MVYFTFCKRGFCKRDDSLSLTNSKINCPRQLSRVDGPAGELSPFEFLGRVTDLVIHLKNNSICQRHLERPAIVSDGGSMSYRAEVVHNAHCV